MAEGLASGVRVRAEDAVDGEGRADEDAGEGREERAPCREVAFVTPTLGNVIVLVEDHFPPFFEDHLMLRNVVGGTDNDARPGRPPGTWKPCRSGE
ncbi:hypothetical protein [Streptomyces sp. TRM49041]|uniref:hypothetical protein n=1 Tax=Streptomyces sp. TRM49041 TaxID=2603216 RepID=UPI0011EF519C|nr:hypothetical protein [Streptomyces sp. TRM49041]